MSVLLPKPRGHSHGADRHIPVLGFDTAHLRSNEQKADKITAVTLLTAYTLNFRGSGADLTICPEVVNLRSVTGRPVDTDHLWKDEKRKLVSRVALDDGKMTGVRAGACWEWNPGQYRHLAHQVEWSIEYPNDTNLVLQLCDFEERVLKTLQPLYPITPVGGSPEISLIVHHVPAGELPPDPEQDAHEPGFGMEPEHFRSYYSVFGGGVPVRLPKYWGRGGDCERPISSTCSPSLGKGGSPFNCMLAGDWP
jgi:hypothetical protein